METDLSKIRHSLELKRKRQAEALADTDNHIAAITSLMEQAKAAPKK